MSVNHATLILFFNKPAMTLRCYQSVVQAQGQAHEHLIYLVDNASTSESAQAIRAEVHSSLARFVRIEKNVGFGSGMNAGLAAAFANPTVEYVTALSNDIELDPAFYENLKKFERPRSRELLCPLTHYLSDREKIAYTHGHYDATTRGLTHRCDQTLNEICFPDYYPAAALVWTRAAFAMTGGFNEDYFCYWEDVDLSWRCQKLGLPLKLAPSLKVHHLGRGTTGGRAGYSEHFRRGQELFSSQLA